MTWPSVQLRRIARLEYGDSLAAENRQDGDVPVYGSNGVVGFHAHPNTDAPAIIVGRKGSYGKLQLTERPAFAIDTTYFIDPRATKAHIRWLHYALSTLGLDEVSQDTGVPGLSRDVAYAQRLPLPSPTEQQAIAAFLDTETARIDALIANKRRMVDVLEQRWVVVCGKLTGVTNSDGRWPSVQLRHVAALQAGAAFPHSDQDDQGGPIPYVKVGDLARVDSAGWVEGAQNRVSAQTARALRSPVLPAETIVLPKIGAALLTNRRAQLKEPSCLDQNVLGVTVTTGLPRFVFFALSAIDLGVLSTPGPVPLLNEEVAASVRVPWPSEDAQTAIVDQLERYRSTHVRALRVLADQKRVLRERRLALIAAAVTGELEVPGVAA